MSWRFSESLQSGDCLGFQLGPKNVLSCKICGKSQVLHVLRVNEVKTQGSSLSLLKQFFCCVRNCRAVFANIDVRFSLSNFCSYWSDLLQLSRRVLTECKIADINKLKDSIISLQNFSVAHSTLIAIEDIPRCCVAWLTIHIHELF